MLQFRQMTKQTRLESFWEWAETERRKRSLSWRAVEKRGNVGNATVSRRANDMSNPTITVCEALARAFSLPKEEVFRQAGLLPSLPNEESKERELLYRIKDLDESARARVLEYVEFLYQRQKKEEKPPIAPSPAEVAP